MFVKLVFIIKRTKYNLLFFIFIAKTYIHLRAEAYTSALKCIYSEISILT